MFSTEAKLNYVSEFVKKQDRQSNRRYFYIYAGNGNNDFTSMEFIGSLKNGITIAPANATEKIGRIAKIQSKLQGVAGITDCIKQIRIARQEKDITSENEKGNN